MLITHDMLAGSKMFVQLTADSKKEAHTATASYQKDAKIILECRAKVLSINNHQT